MDGTAPRDFRWSAARHRYGETHGRHIGVPHHAPSPQSSPRYNPTTAIHPQAASVGHLECLARRPSSTSPAPSSLRRSGSPLWNSRRPAWLSTAPGRQGFGRRTHCHCVASAPHVLSVGRTESRPSPRSASARMEVALAQWRVMDNGILAMEFLGSGLIRFAGTSGPGSRGGESLRVSGTLPRGQSSTGHPVPSAPAANRRPEAMHRGCPVVSRFQSLGHQTSDVSGARRAEKYVPRLR